MCFEQQANAEEKEKFNVSQKGQQKFNALVEKKIQKLVNNKKRRKTEKEHQHFQ